MEAKFLLLGLFIFAFTGADVFVNNDEDPFPDSSWISDRRSLFKRDDSTKTTDTTITEDNKSTTLIPTINTSPRTEKDLCWIQPNMSSDDIMNKCYKTHLFANGYSDKKPVLNVSSLTEDDLQDLFVRAKQTHVHLIIKNSTFTALHFPLLESFTEGLTVSDNLHLKTLDTGRVMKIKGQELVIENNSKLVSIWLANLKSVDLKKGLFLKNNPTLTSVNLGTDYPTPNDFSVEGKGLQIINNRDLSSIKFDFLDHNGKVQLVQSSVNVRISGNPMLGEKRLQTLRDLFENVPPENKYIQDEGECVFPEPLEHLEDLRICKYVLGDLVISPHADNFTSPTPFFQLPEVRNGSIVINGTNLLDLAIFNGTKVDVLEISNSCISMADIVISNITYESLIYVNNTCPRNCTPEDLLTYKQPDCEVIVGDIIMEWIFYKEEDVRIFKSIKKVIGRIVLNGIHPEINVTSSLMFDNLEEINTPNGGTSMELWNLRYTDKFIAPRLKTVKNPDRHFLVMKGNDFLRSLEECLRLEANLSSRQFDPRDLVVQGIVTELIPIDEDSLHFYDDQERGADAVFLPVILLIPSFFILYD